MRGDLVGINNLSLGYKTFINKEANEDDLEICQWSEDGESKWTIASFDYNKKEDCYCLNSCCDRLDNDNIDWKDFGLLVREGYKILNSLNRGDLNG